MPRYDFRCPECGTTEQITTGIDDIADYTFDCHLCHTSMIRIFAPIAIVFKGSGWAGKEKLWLLAG